MLMSNTLDNLIKERAPLIFKSSLTANLLRRLLMKIFKYEETTKTINEISKLNYPDVFNFLGDEYTPNVSITGLDNIPNDGSALIVANHPMGPADAISLISKLQSKRKDIYIFANKVFIDLVPPFSKCMAPLYWDGNNEIHSANKSTLSSMLTFINAGMIGIYFPSGRVAKYGLSKTNEYPWYETPLTIASRYNLKIIPVYIDAKNSFLFYLARSLHKNLRDISQIYELINKKNKRINITIGGQISRNKLNNDSKKAIQDLRVIVESLR